MSYRHREVRSDFSGGINLRDNQFSLEPTESPDMKNILVGKRGGISVRPDVDRYMNTPVTEGHPARSLFEYIDPDRQVHLFSTAGGRLCVAGDTWEPIHDGFTSGAFFEFINHPFSLSCLFVNGKDGYWQTDGETANLVEPYEPTGDELIETGECIFPEDPKIIAFWDRRVWMASTDDHPDRVYLNVDDVNGNSLYNYFTAWSWIRATNVKGEGVTALRAYRNALVVFTETSMRAILWAEDIGIGEMAVNYQVREITDRVGAVSQSSVQEVGGLLLFLGTDGVYAYDGENQPYKISQRIDPIFKKMSVTWRNRASAITHEDKYMVSFARETDNDITLVYDTDVVPIEYIGERFAMSNSPWTIFDDFSPWRWVRMANHRLYFADDDGYVYEYGVDVDDPTKKIEAYYTTSAIDLKVPDMVKRIRGVDFDADQFENSFLQIHYKLDDEDDWHFLAEMDQDTKKYRFVNFKGYKPLCRKITLKFSNGYTGCKFRLNSFALDMAVRGQQKEVRSYV